MENIDLEYKLNSRFRMPFQDYDGSIPQTVPRLREADRRFAGGDIVLAERVQSLTPDERGRSNQEGINGWGKGFNLADLCLAFENFVILQKNSGFLTGIRGVVEKDGQTYIAVDVDAVKAAIKNGSEKYFTNQFSASETVHYQSIYRTPERLQAENVILLPYDKRSFRLTPDQSKAVDGKRVDKDYLINGRDMAPGEIVAGQWVIHPVWSIYSSQIVVPLVQRLKSGFWDNNHYQFDEMMGVYLPNPPLDNQGHGSALHVSGLSTYSRLFCGLRDLGEDYLSCIIGVDKKYVDKRYRKKIKLLADFETGSLTRFQQRKSTVS